MPKPPPKLDLQNPLHLLAQKLRELRENSGNPSYRDISKRIGGGIDGVSPAALSRYFNGAQLPSLDVLEHLLRALGVRDRESYEAMEQLRRKVVEQQQEMQHDRTKSHGERDQAWGLFERAQELMDVGLIYEAHRATVLSVGIFRQLLEDGRAQSMSPHSGDHALGLAYSLGLLSNQLTNAERLDEADDAARESMELCSMLTIVNRGRFEPHLARTLANLGRCLSLADKHEEAIVSMSKAVEILAGLAEDDHIKYVPLTAHALYDLGVIYATADRRSEAIKAVNEAVDLYGVCLALSEEDATLYLPDLAYALDALSKVLIEAEGWIEALSVAMEAVDLFRYLSGTNPAEFDNYLEEAVSNLAVISGTLEESGTFGLALFKAKRYKQAMDASVKEIDLFRERGDRVREGWALIVLGSSLGEMGRHDDAVATLRESADIFRSVGDGYSEGVALSNLGTALRNVGNISEAESCWRRAIRLFTDVGASQNIKEVQQLMTETSH